jgi:hypothetical protein
MRLHVDLVEPMYEDLMKYSGHSVDDFRENGYINSNNPLSRVTFLKKQFFNFSWNSAELYTNLLHPTVQQKNFGHRADNLKIILYQSPLNTTLNNQLICLIICYILCGKGYVYRDMIQAQQDGRTLCVRKLIDYCCEIGFDNACFIDELLKLNYGNFNTQLKVLDKDRILGSGSIFKNEKILIDDFIKELLVDIRKTIKKKQN